MNQQSRIFVAGARGLVGSAIVRKLTSLHYEQVLTPTSSELDLRDQAATHAYFREHKPTHVFLAAAKVGGIHANNTYRADFILDNLLIQNSVITAAKEFGVEKLLFLGSSCIYPRECPQPMREEYMLTGPLEPTNEPYAVAKIAGLKLCEALQDQYNFNAISCMPTNLYGPHDNFDLNNSHVLPAMIRKFHEAKVNNNATVHLWGSGTPMREFLHCDDAADAMVHLMLNYNDKVFVNIGTGTDVTIKELAETIQRIVGHKGVVDWDASKPDGTPRKLLDVSKLHSTGWKHKIDLEEGIRSTYEWFLHNQK